MKFRALIRAIRLRREEVDFEDDVFGKSTLEAKLLKHRKNQERTSRVIQGILNHMHVVHLEQTCRLHAEHK